LEASARDGEATILGDLKAFNAGRELSLLGDLEAFTAGREAPLVRGLEASICGEVAAEVVAAAVALAAALMVPVVLSVVVAGGTCLPQLRKLYHPIYFEGSIPSSFNFSIIEFPPLDIVMYWKCITFL
jgi:hypothetical protein